MKRFLAIALMLVFTLSSSALAADLARFQQAEGVTVECDPANPTAYSVLAGFSGEAGWTQPGGHMLIRYKNMGRSEELPLILISFTTSGFKAGTLSVRTDAHRYDAVCTDLAGAGLSAIDSEASVLVNGASLAMLEDMAGSEIVRITLENADSAESETLALGASDRATLQLFLDEYAAEVAPMLQTSANLAKVYDVLSPSVTAQDAEDLTALMAEFRAEEYVPLRTDDVSDAVAALQQALIDLGCLSGKADGIFGKKTAEAVRRFQAACGLEVTGVADVETQVQLRLAKIVEE